MSALEVNLISAFGRGETLAIGLQEHGFKVRVLDFTAAFSEKYNHGVGPFPVVRESYASIQKLWTDEVRSLPRGLSFWLPDGVLETKGPMADFFKRQNPAFESAAKDEAQAEFKEDWLRRFMGSWAAPLHVESWLPALASSFPFLADVGLIPASKEPRVQTFERFQTLDYEYVPCKLIKDVSIKGSRLAGIEVESGSMKAFGGEHWVWCLAGHETELVGASCMERLFGKSLRRPEWVWMNLIGACERGDWSSAFPEYSIVLGDVFLPWNYANAFVMRWIEPDVFDVWMKVPAASVFHAEQRARWAKEAQDILMARLPHARWAVNPEEWSLCPHSPVFDLSTKDWRAPSWKNWDWIAPETLSRLDWSARLQAEARCYDRLIQLRNEKMKKQGVERDRALHPS